MWYWKDGKRIGVLNDYDLSSLADDPGPRGNERTGTVPFMALDLLTEEGQRGEVKHLYRHDLESFMWCFAWISLRYKEGVILPRGLRPFDEWATLGPVACGKEKFVFQAYRKVPARLHKDQLIWEFVVDCFDVLDTHAFNRRKQLLRSTKRADKLTNYEESETDMDCFLQSFRDTESWAAFSKPIRESSQ